MNKSSEGAARTIGSSVRRGQTNRRNLPTWCSPPGRCGRTARGSTSIPTVRRIHRMDGVQGYVPVKRGAALQGGLRDFGRHTSAPG